MDPRGNIYEDTKERPVKAEDAARLDGYLKARAERDEAREKGLQSAEEKVAALLKMQPAAERTEYRVVGRDGDSLGDCASLEQARELASYGLLEGEVPLTVQSRTVTETPWEDIADA